MTVVERYRFKLLLLFLLGVSLQFGFAFIEERGLDAIRDRMVDTGHAEFATIAVQQDSLLYVASHYESLIESGQLGEYAPSKPPGTLLFYMVTEKLAGVLAADDDTDSNTNLDITAAGALNLTGDTVSIISTQAMALSAGTDFDITSNLQLRLNAAVELDLSGGSMVDVNGGIITLN